MQIKNITLKNFRKFKNETFVFDDKLNVVAGKNESGKSTLMSAIKYAIFGDPTTRSKVVLNDIRSWSKEKRNSNLPVIEMEFFVKDEKFFLRKDFGKRQSVLKNLSNNKESDIEEPKEVQEKLIKMLGIESKEIFESTGCINQEDISKIRKSNSLLSSIQNAASSSGHDGDAQLELKKLEKDIAELQTGLNSPAKNPGPIKHLQDETKRLREELTTSKAEWEQIVNEAKKQKGDQERFDEVKLKIQELDELMSNQKKFEEANQKLQQNETQLTRNQKDLKQLEEFRSQIAQIDIVLEKFKGLEKEDLDQLVMKISQIEEDVRLRKETLTQIQTEIEQIEPKLNGKNNQTFLYLGLGIILVALVMSVVMNEWIILGLGAIFALIPIGYFIYSTMFSQNKVRLSNLKTKYTELTEVLKNDERKIDELLSRYKMENKDQFFIAKGTIVGQKENRKQIESAMKNILGDKTFLDLKNEQDRLLMERKSIETTELTDDIKRSKLAPDEYLRKRRELDMLKMEERRLSEEITIAKTRIGDAKVSLEDIGTREMALERMEKKLIETKYKLKVLKKVKEFIEKAIADTSTLASRIIKQDIEKILPSITSGRYSQARITEELGIEIYSEEKKEWIEPVGKLSSGTIDQIFFLVRLSFLKLISSEQRPLILLDDPFLTFDRARFEKSMEMLQTLSEEYQIFYFTHDESTLKLGYANKLMS